MIYAKNEGEIGAKDGAKLNPYEDIGGYLAEEIIQLVEKYHLPLLEPDNKIRATVIGAGAFSLSISGSTCYYDEAIELPLENIPVVPISLDYKELLNEEKKDDLKKRIDLALNNFNLVESEDLFALYFKDIMLRTVLVPLAKNIEEAFFNSIKKFPNSFGFLRKNRKCLFPGFRLTCDLTKTEKDILLACHRLISP